MGFWDVALAVFGMAFSVGALAIVLEHFQKIAAIKAQVRDKSYRDALRRVDELAQQLEQIRQTHADYVLDIDSHLKHLEYKISALEERIQQMEQQQVVRQ